MRVLTKHRVKFSWPSIDIEHPQASASKEIRDHVIEAWSSMVSELPDQDDLIQLMKWIITEGGGVRMVTMNAGYSDL